MGGVKIKKIADMMGVGNFFIYFPHAKCEGVNIFLVFIFSHAKNMRRLWMKFVIFISLHVTNMRRGMKRGGDIFYIYFLMS